MPFTIADYRADVDRVLLKDVAETISWIGDGVGSPVDISAWVDGVVSEMDGQTVLSTLWVLIKRSDVSDPRVGDVLHVRDRVCNVAMDPPKSDHALIKLLVNVGGAV